MKALFFAAALALGAGAGTAAAQSYPTGPITLLHGFAPGGSADTVARLIAEPLSKRLGVPVVVETKPGSGGNLAAAAIAAAKPNGYTIGLVTGGHAVSKGLYKKLPFDPVEDFTMLGTVVEYNFVLAVPATSSAQTLGDLLAQAKAKPGDISFGSAGIGTTHHLAGQLLASMAGVELTHIPYRGEGAAITGLLGGEIPLIIASPVTLEPQIKAGKLRALAVTSNQRWSGLPDVPTVAEAGVKNFNVSTWSGMLGPKGLPADVQAKLHTELLAVLAMPEVSAKIEKAVGGVIVTSSADEMKARVASEAERWIGVIKAAGIEQQ
jgi:tripartite-type tricarboxylate transporter receptor subunit TctC